MFLYLKNTSILMNNFLHYSTWGWGFDIVLHGVSGGSVTPKKHVM